MSELGADRVIDYNQTELVALDQRFDAIFDVFGNYRFDKLKHLLAPRGTYVQTIPSVAHLQRRRPNASFAEERASWSS